LICVITRAPDADSIVTVANYRESLMVSGIHRILLATDGSPSASAALQTIIEFPWNASARVKAVVATMGALDSESVDTHAFIEHTTHRAADAARDALAHRWRAPEVVEVEMPAIDAILAQAAAFDATVIAMGWRGHGALERLLAGSVSRAVAARADCPVLIVREAPCEVRRFMLGHDGSPNASQAVEFLCTFDPGHCAGEVRVVNVVDLLRMPPAAHLLPASARSHLSHEIRDLQAELDTAAARAIDSAVQRLNAAGWDASGAVRHGAPLAELLASAKEFRADVLVVGARAVSGLERAVLGSVANGALNHSKIPVLLVR
jgi:nucleotide-binding universal stress UspA family protein